MSASAESESEQQQPALGAQNLDQVKSKFIDQPSVDNQFLDSVKEFKAQTSETSGVIAKISTLFRCNTRYCKHIIHVIAFFTTIVLAEYFVYRSLGGYKSDELSLREFSYIATAAQLVLFLFVAPQIICNILGLLLLDAFPGEIKMKKPTTDEAKSKFLSNGYADAINHDDELESTATLSIPTISLPPYPSPVSASCPALVPTPTSHDKGFNLPHLCFRVVTRGLYPELVQDNARKNFTTCINSGLSNFSIEIITDKDIHLMSIDQRVKQLVVPTNYQTSTGALFKARALQYALEPGVSSVEDRDYLVHLDEETVITKNVVNGIMNFALEGKHDFGQGLITYANLEIVNLFTTLADSIRVAEDMGKLRFTLGALHKPLFSWKGSFVVAKCGAEKDVSFDHGPDGSIAEDCCFCMVAYKKGYTFDFIQGEMYEKSPFTIMDLIRQRKRWIQGIGLVVHSSKIPIRTKFFLAISYYFWLAIPISSFGFVIMSILGVHTHYLLQPIGTFFFATTLYLYIFGLVISLDLKKSPYSMLFVCLIAQVITIALSMVVENAAVVWGLFGQKHNFYIVKKEIGSKVVSNA